MNQTHYLEAMEKIMLPNKDKVLAKLKEGLVIGNVNICHMYQKIFLILLLLFNLSLFGARKEVLNIAPVFAFKEHKGQLIHLDKPLSDSIKFYAKLGNGLTAYFLENKVLFVAKKVNYENINNDSSLLNGAKSIDIQRLDLLFNHSNKNINIVGKQPLKFYDRYIGKSAKDIEKISSYKEITYLSICRGIDLIFGLDSNRLSYRFELNESADIKDINFSWQGGEVKVAEKSLEIETPLFGMKETGLKAFYANEKEEKVDIAYATKGNRIGFKVNAIKGRKLVIDPFLDFASYFGSRWDDQIVNIKVNTNKDIFILGNSSGDDGIGTKGAFQQHLFGDTINSINMIMVKYDSLFQKNWGTYFGGKRGINFPKFELSENNLYFSLISGDTNKFLSTTGAYLRNPKNNNNYNIIGKFDTSGKRVWSTFYGSETTKTNRINNITAFGSNLYIYGNAEDRNLGSKGAFKSFGNGIYKDLIVHFDTSGRYKRATFSKIKIVKLKPYKNNLLIVGSSISKDSISTKGTQQTQLKLKSNACFSVMDTALNKIIKGSYFGDTSTSYFRDVVTDKKGNLYFSGSLITRDFDTFFKENKLMFQSGKENIFISHFDSNFKMITGGLIDIPLDLFKISYMERDTFGKFYIANGNNNYLNPNQKFTYLDSKFQTMFTDSLLSTNQKRYMDIGGLSLDSFGNLYLIGRYSYKDNFVTKNAIKSNHSGTTYDGYILRYNQLYCPRIQMVTKRVPTASLCLNNYINYEALQLTGHKYFWKTDGGVVTSPSDTSNKVEVLWTKIKYGYVKLTVTEPLFGCQDSITLYTNINNGFRYKVNVKDTCFGQSVKCSYEVDSVVKMKKLYYFYWRFSDGDSTRKQSPEHTFKNPGIAEVFLQARDSFFPYCQYGEFRKFTLSAPIQGFYSKMLAKNEMAYFPNDTSIGNKYTWDIKNGIPPTNTDSIYKVLFNKDTTFYLKLTVKDKEGCISSTKDSLMLLFYTHLEEDGCKSSNLKINISNGNLIIDLNHWSSKANFQLMDSKGALLNQGQINEKEKIDVHYYPSGIYYLLLKGDDGRYISKKIWIGN